jgi:hypothetical protein
MSFCQAELTILNRSSTGEGNHQKGNLVQDLAQKDNHKRNNHKEVVRVGCEVTIKCIGSRNPVASSYAQNNNSTFEQKFWITTSIRS